MQRQLSLFELQPSFRREVEHGKNAHSLSEAIWMCFFLQRGVVDCLGIDRDGCSLSGVSARCHWEERRVSSKTGGTAWRTPEAEKEDDDSSSHEEEDEEEEESEGATPGRHRPTPDSEPTTNGEIWPIRRLYKGVHLTLNLEAASLLPVVLRYYIYIYTVV